MKPYSDVRPTRPCSLIAFGSVILSCVLGYAGQSINGFRDLTFGMTEQEVSAIPACRNSTECLYELTDKNRYLELTYLSETVSNSAESAGSRPISRLAKITIDMGPYTDEWHQQLQVILGESYRLTQDLTPATMESFAAKQQDELIAGYENGQVLLMIVRRPFGNLTMQVVYQNADLAANFIQQMKAEIPSPK